MGFSCEGHFEEKEREFELIDETSVTRQNSIIMEVYHQNHHGVDINTDFFPVEHPMEPPDEDRPVKCPMPESSVIRDERMHEKRNAESLRKRGEISGAIMGQRTASMDTEAPAQGVRKRHHTLTHGSVGDIVMTPLMRMPPLPPLQSQNFTIFQVLQQLDKFES
ncbi:uncharacterized protein [Cicer arietinum]|uniref:Uncharacterized protein LOC101492109 n=1 Tax=Cicer arietinum TaxID=3827 RepID=A0A1S2YGU1_CICAR|nr:uncharacterized protein LOC101492109 [Cicer arietinum]